VLRIAARYACEPATFGIGRHIAPAHEGLRNKSNNKAHEPTSGRSTHYGSEHLIRVFRDIGHIFSSPYPFIGARVLVALPPSGDLWLCAKRLFIAARVSISRNLLDKQLKFPRGQVTVPTLDGAAFTTLAYGPSQPQY
jgi:hypothetical protein